jgi:hypothetical protein
VYSLGLAERVPLQRYKNTNDGIRPSREVASSNAKLKHSMKVLNDDAWNGS